MTGDGWWNFDTPNVIPICWKNRLFPQLINPMEEAIHEWADSSGVTVTPIPFPDCPSSTPRQVSIGFKSDMAQCQGGGLDGYAAVGMTSALNRSADPEAFSITALVCPTTGHDTNTGLMAGTGGARVFARHEFGHTLGMSHEQDRPENAGGVLCNSGVDTKDGGILLTDYDPDSVLNYCHSQSRLTALDIAGLQAAYGFEKNWSRPTRNFCSQVTRKMAVGDFNGNGQDDILCIDTSNGDISVDLVSASGQFNGDDWSQAGRNFCVGAGKTLLVGSTRGGREDLICNDTTTGVISVDRASSTGQFTGTDWSTTRNFCQVSGSKIAAGYFNADNRVDLVCIEPNGRMAVDLANTNGEYWSDDWSSATRNFCRFSNERLFVGDVNGDGRDDLVCNNGGLYVDRASSTGTFTSNDFSNNSRNFCTGANEITRLADVNDDGRQDYVCWNRSTGFMQADLANEFGEFWSTNWQGPFSAWCAGTGDAMLSGDFDTTGGQDLLCIKNSGQLKAQYFEIPL